jgi:hypothetical protein
MFRRGDSEYKHVFASFTPSLVNDVMKPACKTTIGENTNTVFFTIDALKELA